MRGQPRCRGMDSRAWRAYFERNQHRAAVPVGAVALSEPMRRAVVRSLQRLHLGEAGEGRIIGEARRSRDPAVDDDVRRAIELYIREEMRHARELTSTLHDLGASTLRRHWSERAFRTGRRFLGLRTKMLAIASAEVVGVEFYGLLRDHVPDPIIAELGACIARDEEMHLAFQAAWFHRVIDTVPAHARRRYVAALVSWYVVIQACAIGVFVADHGPVLAATGVGRRAFVRRCVARIGHALAHARAARSPSSLERSAIVDAA